LVTGRRWRNRATAIEGSGWTKRWTTRALAEELCLERAAHEATRVEKQWVEARLAWWQALRGAVENKEEEKEEEKERKEGREEERGGGEEKKESRRVLQALKADVTRLIA
jgi:hypothetical protein